MRKPALLARRLSGWLMMRTGWIGLLGLLILALPKALGLPARTLASHPEPGFSPTAALTLGGHESEIRLKTWQKNYPGLHVIALQAPDRWTQRAGLRPDMRSIADYLLAKQGFDPAEVPRILLEKVYGWHTIRALGAWLELEPNRASRLVVVVDPVHLLRLQMAASRLLEPGTRGRLRFDTLNHADLTPGTWWRSRSGWKDLATGWFAGLYALLAGEGDEPAQFDPLDASGKGLNWQPVNEGFPKP